MGEEKTEDNSKHTSLETILENELYRAKETNIFKRAKQGIEKIVLSNKNKFLISVSAVSGYVTWYIMTKSTDSSAYIAKLAHSYTDMNYSKTYILGAAAALIAGLLSNFAINKYVGKKLCSLEELGIKQKEIKTNFLLQHKLKLSLITGAGTISAIIGSAYLSQHPKQIQWQMIMKNANKVILSLVPYMAGIVGSTYLMFHSVGTLLQFKDKDLQKAMVGEGLYSFSKKKGLKYLENESQKNNIYASRFLADVKKGLDERLELRKRIIDSLPKDQLYYSKEPTWTKYQELGKQYYIFKRKKEINSILDITMQIYYANPQRAIRIINKLSQSSGKDAKPGILATRNYFLNRHSKDSISDWQELRFWLEKEGKLQLIESTEGQVSRFMDEFVNKNFIFKDYAEDKSDKFFIETTLKEIFKGTPILVETPLFYYDEGGLQKHIFIRDGEKNLREELKQANIEKRRECFKKAISLLLDYQEIATAALEKQGDEFILNSEFHGETRRIIIPIIDLEKNLMRRAFMGSKQGEMRLGVNEYLPFLILKIHKEDCLNPYRLPFAFNHGDAVTTNITKTLCVIDPHAQMAPPPQDSTHISCDSVFFPLSFESRKESFLENALKRDHFRGLEKDLNKAFNSLYLKNCLCRSGATLHLGNKEETAFVLNELLEFSKAKQYERELLDYLKHSNAKDLLKLL